MVAIQSSKRQGNVKESHGRIHKNVSIFESYYYTYKNCGTMRNNSGTRRSDVVTMPSSLVVMSDVDTSEGGGAKSPESIVFDLREKRSPSKLVSVWIPTLIIEVYRAIRRSAVVLGTILWLLAFCFSCVVWLIGHIILSCVTYGSSVSSVISKDDEAINKEGLVGVENLSGGVVTNPRHNGVGGKKRRRRRKKTNNTSSDRSDDRSSGCGSCSSSVGSSPGIDEFDDPLPTTDLKRLETCLLEIRTNTNCTGELTQAQECSSIIGSMELTGDDEITASSSKSLLDMWLCPDFSFKEPATVASGQDNETSKLDPETSLHLQRILDLVALQAFLGLHRDAEHLRDQLTSLVCHEIGRDKANMAVLNSIIEI